eukprot:UC1_evm1s196
MAATTAGHRLAKNKSRGGLGALSSSDEGASESEEEQEEEQEEEEKEQDSEIIFGDGGDLATGKMMTAVAAAAAATTSSSTTTSSSEKKDDQLRFRVSLQLDSKEAADDLMKRLQKENLAMGIRITSSLRACIGDVVGSHRATLSDVTISGNTVSFTLTFTLDHAALLSSGASVLETLVRDAVAEALNATAQGCAAKM